MNEAHQYCRYRISGRVQGVYFRASTRQQALALSLTGQAVNLPNGEVEVRAYGAVAAQQALERWLWQGPPQAKVEAVTVEVMSLPQTLPTDFSTG